MNQHGLYETEEDRLRDMAIAKTDPRLTLRITRDSEGTLHLRSPSENEIEGLLNEQAAATTRLVIDRAMRNCRGQHGTF